MVFFALRRRTATGKATVYLFARSVKHSHTRSRASESEAAMPTPLSLGSNLTYHAALESQPHRVHMYKDSRRPLVVIAGWMGAKAHQLKTYQRFYHDRGCDTLSFAVGPQHVLFPDKAIAQMERVLELCLKPTRSETRPLTSLSFHMFSVGGYCYGQMLRIINSQQQRFASIPRVMSAQVFDSPPDIAGIAKGKSLVGDVFAHRSFDRSCSCF